MGEIIKGKLKNGFMFSIPVERFGKWKTLQLLRGMKTDPTLLMDVVERLLEDQANAFIDSLGEDPSIEDVSNAVKEIFDIAKSKGESEETKKSSPLPD